MLIGNPMTRALLRLQSAMFVEFIFKTNGQGSFVSQDPSVVLLLSILRGWAQRASSLRPLEAGREFVPWPQMTSDLSGF